MSKVMYYVHQTKGERKYLFFDAVLHLHLRIFLSVLYLMNRRVDFGKNETSD